MTRNLSSYALKASIVILVLVLHGATVWAMMSIQTPARPEITPVIQPIQIELITLDTSNKALSTDTQLVTPKPKKVEAVEPQSTLKSAAPKPPEVKSVQTLTQKEPTQKISSIEPTVSESKDTRQTVASDVKDSKPNTSQESSVISAQKLSTHESRTITRATTQTDDSEFDLAAMIRAINAQYKREQAKQRKSLAKQADRKLRQQEEWRLQAENETITKMLALAAEQAENQQADIDTSASKNDENTSFTADFGSWRDERKPITSMPTLVWQSVDRDLGDVFIVLLELQVDKEGSITEVQILETSGSPIIDAIATTQVRSGQLNPIQNGGIEVDAVVPMSLIYERPTFRNKQLQASGD